MRASRVLFLAFGLATATPALAQADDPAVEDRARELYENGRILYEEGRYEEAILAWEEAYRLSKRPRIRFNLASAYEKLGDLKKALDELYAFQVFAPAEERDTIDRRIRTIVDRLKAEDNNPVPVPVPVPVANPVPDPRPERGGGGGPSIAGLALVGVGVLAAGTGAVFGISSAGAKGRLQDQCVDTGGDRFCPASAEDDLRAHRRNALIADVGFLVGALSGGTGVVLLAVGNGKNTSVGVGLGHVRLSGRW